MDTPIELQALDLLQKIAEYRTYDEVMASTDNDDARQALREEVMDSSSDTLDALIASARTILGGE